MPDQRKHRGPHPGDRQLFARDNWPRLRSATRDLSWLFSRGYAEPSSLKLVGDRYALDARQRLAVARCACGDEQLICRKQHQIQSADLRGRSLWIDGYNVLTSLEAALADGVILLARDGCFRDMASMHGSYRKVAETAPAIELFGRLLQQWEVADCRWLLDQPVSNSGRLKTLLTQLAAEQGWPWEVELVPDPDPILMNCDQIIASADSQIINRADRWFNLARETIEARIPTAWIVDLSDCW